MRLSIFLLVPAVALAQAPRVGVVEIYGTRRVPAAEVRKIVATAPGDPLPASKGDLQAKLEEMPGVAHADITAVCCESRGAILYVGIAEQGTSGAAIREAPSGELYVPTEIADAYQSFLDAVSSAARSGNAGEDLSQGHSLVSDAKARAVQQKFVPLATQYAAELRNVIREAGGEDQRAIAAYVLGYQADKKEAEQDLLFALRDPDPAVREHAMRGLAALAVYARKNPASGLDLTAEAIVDLLNSPVWTDRHGAAVMLVTLTEDRNSRLLALLGERAKPSVIEMAAWRHLPHALPAFILAGRMAGMSEPALQQAWSAGRRAEVLRRLRATSPKAK